MDKLHVDFESYSDADLTKVGLDNYLHDPTTGIWCMAYKFDDGPTEICSPFTDESFPVAVTEHIKAGGKVVAHNAPFEFNIFKHVLKNKHIRWEQMDCTMARCYAMSLPGALENAASALGLRVTKDTEGRALMLRMCKPMAHDKDRPLFANDVGRFTFMGESITFEQALKRLMQYCVIDVDVEHAIDARVQPLSPKERYIWLMDQRINERGAYYDPAAIDGALEIKDEVIENLNEEMGRITKGEVKTCGAIAAMKGWLADHGVARDSLAKAVLGELLEVEGLPPDVRRVLELRKEAGRATSVAKVEAMQRLASADRRIRNTLQYHGAGTGRWAARGLQPHNFPRDLPKPDEVARIMRALRESATAYIDALYGPPLKIISQVLRAFLKAAPGKQLMGGDFSNVEGRKLAWLAGEDWKVQAFKDYDAGLGPDIYVASYAKTFGVGIDEVDDNARQVGKVIELAFGYAGGEGAWNTMATAYGIEEKDSEFIQDAKHSWRDAHPAIKNYWYQLEAASIRAVQESGKVCPAGAPGRHVKFKKQGSFLWCLLPSGRVLCYPYPKLHRGPYGTFLSYKTVPSPILYGAYSKALSEGKLDEYAGQVVHEKGNSKMWCRVSTYGGKLAENVTQASCRDLLAETMVQAERKGYPAVMHVHDEIIVEGEFDNNDLSNFTKILNTPPKWAAGFPRAAGCWLAERYQK